MNRTDINLTVLSYRIPEKLATKHSSRFVQPEDREDYIQDMNLELLELDDEKVFRLWDRGELLNYFAKICCNQLLGHRDDYWSHAYNKRIKYQRYETEIASESDSCFD